MTSVSEGRQTVRLEPRLRTRAIQVKSHGTYEIRRNSLRFRIRNEVCDSISSSQVDIAGGPKHAGSCVISCTRHTVGLNSRLRSQEVETTLACRRAIRSIEQSLPGAILLGCRVATSQSIVEAQADSLGKKSISSYEFRQFARQVNYRKRSLSGI